MRIKREGYSEMSQHDIQFLDLNNDIVAMMKKKILKEESLRSYHIMDILVNVAVKFISAVIPDYTHLPEATEEFCSNFRQGMKALMKIRQEHEH